jgi:hypothetical protein
MGIDAVMWVDCGRTVTDDELAKFNYRLCEAFGRGWFDCDAVGLVPLKRLKDNKPYLYDPPYKDHGDLLEVPLGVRYYSVGYPRGPAHMIVVIGAFLEKLTGGKVWYGGDCHDSLEVFDRAAQTAMWDLFCEDGGMSYGGSFGSAPCPNCAGMPVRFNMACREGQTGNCVGCGIYVAQREGNLRDSYGCAIAEDPRFFTRYVDAERHLNGLPPEPAFCKMWVEPTAPDAALKDPDAT